MKARTPENPAQVNGNGKTAQSYIAGIGASGALLAGAVVSFVFLVGAVSFEVWPTAAGQLGGDDSLGVAELSGPGAGGSSESSLGEAVSLLAAAVPSDVSPDVTPKGSGGLEGGGGGSEGGGGTVPGSTGGSVGGSDGSIADTPGDDPDSGDDGGSGGPSNGPGGGNNGPARDTGNTGTNGGGTSTTGTTGSTGTTGAGSGGSGGGGSNHSSR